MGIIKILRRVVERLALGISFLFSEEPRLKVNGTQVQFLKSGDLYIQVGRHLVIDYELAFFKTAPNLKDLIVRTFEAQGLEGVKNLMIPYQNPRGVNEDCPFGCECTVKSTGSDI
jgi:hypothetical protein